MLQRDLKKVSKKPRIRAFRYIIGELLGVKVSENEKGFLKLEKKGGQYFIDSQRVVPSDSFRKYRPCYCLGSNFGKAASIAKWKVNPKPTDGSQWEIDGYEVITQTIFDHHRPRYCSRPDFGKAVSIDEWKVNPKPIDGSPWEVDGYELIEAYKFRGLACTELG